MTPSQAKIKVDEVVIISNLGITYIFDGTDISIESQTNEIAPVDSLI